MKIITDNNLKLQLKIAGSGKISSIEYHLIEQLGQRVELINRIIEDEELEAVFDDIDIVILPYIDASQSGVIMLSYSFAKPVIATDVGGMPEQVTSDTGILIPPNDEIVLAYEIEKLYKTPEKILEMGLKAYDYVQNNYSWDSIIKKLIDILR
jgi:glycosyltransferase involved in cell wall biosynthesis